MEKVFSLLLAMRCAEIYRDDREEYVADDAAFEESGFGIEDVDEDEVDDFAGDDDDDGDF